MSETKKTRIRNGALAIVFVVCIVGGFACFFKAVALRSFVSIGFVLLGCGCFVAAGVICAVPLAHLFSLPFGRLFFPEERYRRALPPYSRAEAMVQRHEYQTAMAYYRKLAGEYPDEVEPYVGMIEIAVRHLHDLDLAHQVYREGMSSLKKIDQQAVLARMYRAIRSRAEPGAEWGQGKKIPMERGK